MCCLCSYERASTDAAIWWARSEASLGEGVSTVNIAWEAPVDGGRPAVPEGTVIWARTTAGRLRKRSR